MRPTIMEVNLENFRFNVNSIREKLSNNCKIMPVIKANAYGTYINNRLDILNEFDIVAVAISDEGEILRKNGYEKEIFILNQPDICEIDQIINNNLIVGVCEKEFIKILGEKNKNVKIHIEIETGMGRTGIKLEEIRDFIDLVKQYENIKIQGIYTHLSSADIDYDYTRKQIETFNEAIKIVKKEIGELKYIHASASNGFINFPEAHYNLVRPGMFLYGYKPLNEEVDKIDLKPVCRLKSKITFLKNVKKGMDIGYSRSYKTSQEIKVATVPIGYADGLKRILSNLGEVCINGKRAKIIGKVCMDSIMVDVTNIPNVKLYDEVWIWDNDNITVTEIAQKCDTINYEIISSISDRVPRIFENK